MPGTSATRPRTLGRAFRSHVMARNPASLRVGRRPGPSPPKIVVSQSGGGFHPCHHHESVSVPVAGPDAGQRTLTDPPLTFHRDTAGAAG